MVLGNIQDKKRLRGRHGLDQSCDMVRETQNITNYAGLGAIIPQYNTVGVREERD